VNLVDSSGWLEYFTDGINASQFSSAIENSEKLLVSVVNIFEVYKKILTARDEHAAMLAVSLMQQAKVIPLTADISIHAASISVQYKIPMADSLVYATARAHNAVVWTQDADFENLPNVKFFRKM
jgi:toxin FitB